MGSVATAKPVMVMMIADQTFKSDQDLGQFCGGETAFINGPESLATKDNYRLFFCHRNHGSGHRLMKLVSRK
jgi:hypothetical protein